MENKKISERDKKLLYILVAVGVFALAYFLGFNKFNEKTDAVEQEMVSLNARLNELRDKQANKQKYIDETEDMKSKMQVFIDEFPALVTTEKSIIFGTELEEDGPIFISDMQFFEMTNFYTPMTDVETPVLDENGNPTGEKSVTQGIDENGVSGYVKKVGIDLRTDYESLKRVVNYVNNSKDRITIDSIELEYNSEDANLRGRVTLNMYAADNTGKEYEPPIVEDVPLGTENIFGTVENNSKKNNNNDNE